MKYKLFILAGILLALALAIFISPFASPHPDGLEWVAEQNGFLEAAENTQPLWNGSPIPDYAIPGIRNESVATALAGLLGVLIVLVIGWFISRMIVRKAPERRDG